MDVMPLLLLVAGSAAVAGLARRTPVPAPLLLVAAGLGAGYLPGVPDYPLDPHVVLPLLLPPLLHTAALDSSYLDLRANLRPVALLSIGYVLFATVAVGYAAYLVIPDLPLTAALVLGAVVAPPDAVAATAIARRLRLPGRITTILQGESLVNDATAITAYKVALAAVVGAGATWAGGLKEFAIASVGGVGIGLVLMGPLHWLRCKLRDNALLENTLSLLIPFVAYAAAEQVGASGVLAVVVVGLYLGHRSWQVNFETRLQEAAVWSMVSFVLESAVFALIGLQLPVVLRGLGQFSTAQALAYAAVVFVVVVLARFVWVFPATYLPRWLSARIREREPGVTRATPVIVGWAGMRGVVSLAIAFSIPVAVHGEPFPARNLVLFLTFSTVIGTLVIQGLTLPPLIRALKLPGPDPQAQTLAEAQAQNDASDAAEERLRKLLEDPRNALPGPLEDRLRTVLERRRNAVWERLGPPNAATGESVEATYLRLSREMIGAEREVFVQLRDARRIDDEMLRTLLRRLDLEEAAAYRETVSPE
ncbi:Na+/H+ antiporter [Streptomyces niger]|uniref:Na+/H+ antiporter n=1 Tax=Streptomyces niger TaxID=66373 RepID=UPI0006993EDD|nr:Na+/H+ antiporter [Streptomyces niger]